jgi:glutathione synthase/RimK-type ligase-like ATP-grasp enzyme
MRLLKITDQELPELDELFEEVMTVKVDHTSPRVIEDQDSVRIGEDNLNDFDSIFADIPTKNAVFGRVLLEMIEERGIPVNYSSTAFFTMAKKNYLYHVLKEKSIPTPKTAVVADQKAVRKLENHLKGPLEAKKIRNLQEVENTKIDAVEEINKFAEGVEYGDNILIFSELSDGEKYRCLIAADKIIGLKDTSEGWRIKSDNLSYSNIPRDLEKIIRDTAKAIGTEVAEVILRGGEVVDVNPNPDLEMYYDISGKNSFEAVAEVLKE